MEYGRMTAYDISIESTQNKRAIVRVGCGSFAFNNVMEVTAFIEEYMSNPQIIRDQCHRVEIGVTVAHTPRDPDSSVQGV